MGETGGADDAVFLAAVPLSAGANDKTSLRAEVWWWVKLVLESR